MKADLTYNVRWLIRRDMAEVMAIENQLLGGWSEKKITQALRERNCIGVVAEASDGPIDGYMIYNLMPDHIAILRVAVNPRDQRCGIGRQLLQRVKDRLDRLKKPIMVVVVDERDLGSQLWLQRCGLLATQMHSEKIMFEWHA